MWKLKKVKMMKITGNTGNTMTMMRGNVHQRLIIVGETRRECTGLEDHDQGQGHLGGGVGQGQGHVTGRGGGDLGPGSVIGDQDPGSVNERDGRKRGKGRKRVCRQSERKFLVVSLDWLLGLEFPQCLIFF
jgi:hypothetical protein